MQKTENDNVEPKLQTLTDIEDETDQDKKDYLETAIYFNIGRFNNDTTKSRMKIEDQHRRYFTCSLHAAVD